MKIQVIQHGIGGVYFHFKNGTPDASAANCRYITRSSATDSDLNTIYLQNYPEFLKSASYSQMSNNLIFYNQLKQDYELSIPTRGRGKARTHFRGKLSFEGKIETEKARELAAEYLQKHFSNARAIAVVHQDTRHTHVHLHIQARAINSKKLILKSGVYKRLDLGWAKIFGREFGVEKERIHIEKKRETHEYRMAIARGEQRAKPVRVVNRSREMYEARERRNIGIYVIEEARIGRSQRAITNSLERTSTRIGSSERTISVTDRMQLNSSTGERAIERYLSASQRGHLEVERGTTEAQRSVEASQRALQSADSTIRAAKEFRDAAEREQRVSRETAQKFQRATEQFDRTESGRTAAIRSAEQLSGRLEAIRERHDQREITRSIDSSRDSKESSYFDR